MIDTTRNILNHLLVTPKRSLVLQNHYSNPTFKQAINRPQQVHATLGCIFVTTQQENAIQ